MTKRIFLIGVMGAGKSTVGRLLAQQSQLPFYDSDQVIVERNGMSIADIFATEGEQGFRQREQAVIKMLSEKPQIVLATGGGCVTVAENRQQLAENGTVIYLRVCLERQTQRLLSSSDRRPLFSDNPDALSEINLARVPLYESIADFTYDTDDLSAQQLAVKIHEDLQNTS